MNNSSIFTLDRKGKGFDIEEYPQGIYVDTSVWNKIYGSQNSSREKDLLTDFMAECLDHDVKFYVSGIVYEELTHIIKEDIMRQEVTQSDNFKLPRYRDGKINLKARDEKIFEQNPDLVATINSSVNEALSFVKDTAEFLPYEEDEATVQIMLDIIKNSRYSIDTRDAKHVIAAHTYDVNSILTCDGDYVCFENLNVYVPPSEKFVKLKIGRANVLLPFDKEKY